MLREIQRTGDIFFPKRWMDATLGGHSSRRRRGSSATSSQRCRRTIPTGSAASSSRRPTTCCGCAEQGLERPQGQVQAASRWSCEVAAMVSPGEKSGTRGGRPSRVRRRAAGSARRASGDNPAANCGSARYGAACSRVLTLLRAFTGMAAPGEREGRGINPARDKRTASGSVKIGLARLREALLLTRATTAHDRRSRAHQSEPLKLRTWSSSPPVVSQARCRPAAERVRP